MSLCRNRNPYDDESFNNPDKINLNDNQSNKLSAGSLRRTKKNKTRMPKDFVFNEEEELKLSQLKKKNSLLDLTDSEEDKEKDININSENSIEKDGEKDKDKIVEIINTDLPNKDIKNEEMKNEENKNEEEKEKENESEKKEEKNEEDIKIEDMENNKENIINNSENKNIDDKDITNGIKEEHIEKEENKKEENIINEEEKKENKVEKEIDNKKENIEEKNDDNENKEKKEEKEIKEEHVEKDEENIEINKKDEQKTEENVEKEEENIQKNKNEEEKDNNEIKQEIKEEKKEKLLSEIINNVEEGKEDKELLRTKPNPNLKEDKKEKEEEYLDEEEEEEEDDEDDKNKKEEPKNESTDLEIKDLSKYETLIKIININLESFGYSKIDIKKEIDNLYGAFSDKTSSDDLVSNLSEKLIKLMEVSQENDKAELKNFINTLVNFYKGNKDEVYKQLMEYTEKIIDQDQLTTRRMNRGIRSNIQECKDKLKDRLKKEDIPSDKIITIEKFEKIVEETELQMKDNHMDVLLYQMKKKVPKGRNFNTLNAIVIVDFLK